MPIRKMTAVEEQCMERMLAVEAQRDRYAAVLRRISTFSVKVGNCKGCRESAHVKDLFYELREIAGAALEEES